MVGGDEIIFSGSYKDFRLGVRFELAGKKPEDVAHVLAHISSEIEPYAFRFSGIDTEKIDDFAKPGKGVSSVSDFLEKNSSEWNKLLKESLSDMLLRPAAESYLFNRLLAKAGVSFKPPAEPLMKAKKEETGEQIAFIGKYGNWVSIKKLSLDKVKDYEVSGILSGINFSAVNKAFDFAGIEKDDAAVSAAAKGKRKSMGNVVLALRQLETDNPYVICKVLEQSGYRPYASPHMLMNAHSDIKPPKVKGRKPKG